MRQPRFVIRRLVFLTPNEFDEQQRGHMDAAQSLGLPWAEAGWAVFECTDDNGVRSTAAVADPEYIRLAAAKPEIDLGDREINTDKIIMIRPGWIDDWPDGSWWLYLPPREEG
jgi:hypothetical protein